MKLSIIISSHNRSELFCRTLYWLNKSKPTLSFETIIVDDGSDEAEKNVIISELKKYKLNWKFIEIDSKKWENGTGLKIYAGNPAFTNNIGFENSRGDLICLVGNECIVYNELDEILFEYESYKNQNSILFTTTYDINLPLNQNGSNLNQLLTPQVLTKPLQSKNLHTDVTNYCSITSRGVWEQVKGYDEIYLSGIACEDSDFVRRAALLPNFQKIRSELVSFHQNHGGKTMYEEPLDIEYSKKFYKGLLINREYYNSWNGKRLTPLIRFKDCVKSIITEDV